jgi:hypothetical protein
MVEKLLNIKQNYQKKLFKSKLKIIEIFESTLGVVGKLSVVEEISPCKLF